MGRASKLKLALQKLRGKAWRCGQTAQTRDVITRTEYCDQCAALGDTWVRLRTCMICGRVGCCDSSKNRHADEAGHPIGCFKEPGEDWMRCYVDDTLVLDGR